MRIAAAVLVLAATACASPPAVKLNTHLPGVLWSCDALRLVPAVPGAAPVALGPIVAMHCVVIDTRRRMLIDVLFIPLRDRPSSGDDRASM